MISPAFRSSKVLALVLALFGLVAASSARADAITITQNGHTYSCEDTGPTGGGDCWSRCPWTFDTCAAQCGSGAICWDKCPWTFDTCAETCGAGSTCWDKCPWTFDTCAETCGHHNVPHAVTERFRISDFARKLAERDAHVVTAKKPAENSGVAPRD